jgi:PAS domain S-box-containing protein
MHLSNLINWFAGGANGYHNLAHCMRYDSFWIGLTVALDLAVAGGYVVIAARWRRNEKGLASGPSKTALGRLKKIFIFCGLCGYLFIPIKMFWPAWRLYDIFMIGLAYLTWRYALGSDELKTIYKDLAQAGRMAQDLADSRADRSLLEERVGERTLELEQAIEALRAEVEERKSSAARLAEERNLLHTLIDALPDLVYVKDTDGRYVLNNPPHLKFLGASAPEHVAGKTVFDFFPPELADKYHADDLRTMADGQQLLNDLEPSIDRAGNARMMTRTKVPLRDSQNRIIGLVGVARDVTQSQDAEAALRESEMRFRSVAHSAADAIVSADQKGNIVFWNQAAERNFGYTEEEVLGKPFAMLITERSRECHGADLEVAQTAGESRPAGRAVELFGLKKDGSEFPAEVSLATWATTQGTFFTGTIRDITRRKNAEQSLLAMNETLERRVAERSAAAEQRAVELTRSENALRKQTAILRSILDNMGDGVVVADERGALVLFNPAAEELLCIQEATEDATLWAQHYDLLLPDGVTSMPLLDRPLARAMRGEPVDEAEMIVCRHSKCETIWVSATARPLKDEDGVVRGGVAVFHDVSYRKRAELELQKAKEAAEAANLAKSEFLANMSHEIRTPMTAIIGYADILLEHDPELSERRKCVEVIRRNGRHLLELINDVLDISKIEAGQMTVEKIRCDLPQLLAEVISMMRPRAMEKGIQFSVAFTGPIPHYVQTDALRARQILVNLLGNAIKFTHKGSVTLRVSCAAVAESLKLHFVLEDTGVGMKQEQMARLFKPFSQADESTTRKFGGTGLGLSISRRLARLLGGDVTVESQFGVGSVFSTTIGGGPAAGAEMLNNLNEATLPAAVSHAVSRDISLHGRILLVDDGLDNQRLISFHLCDAGADVTVAQNGLEAVDLAGRESFDLILMDMQMPEMDGYAAAAELRRRGLTLPIIALTAHAMSDDREKCLASGCTEYLTKPIDKGLLLRTVASYLPEGAELKLRLTQSEPEASAPAAPSPTGQPDNPSQQPGQIRSSHSDMPKMQTILRQFIADLPALVGQISAWLGRGDLDLLRRAAHQLRGSGGGYGFPQLTDPSFKLEHSIAESQPREVIVNRTNELVALIRRIEGYDPGAEENTNPPLSQAS